MIALVVLGILAVPLGSTFIDLVQTGRDTNAVQHTLEREFEGAEVIEVDLDGDTVTATIRSPNPITQPDVQTAEDALESALDRDINLEVTYWQSITP